MCSASWLCHGLLIILPLFIHADDFSNDYSSLFSSYYSPYYNRHLGRSPCQPNPCQYEGECSVSGTSFDCSCPAGRKGERCEGKLCKVIVCIIAQHLK